jgi:hypothetical protein
MPRPPQVDSQGRAEILVPQTDPKTGAKTFRVAQNGGVPGQANPPSNKAETRPANAPNPGAAPAASADHSRALAETVVSSFVNRLTSEAQRKGGWLSVQDLQNLNQEFIQKTEALQVIFEKSFEDYFITRERAVWMQERKYPFDRLIVKTFSHRLPGESELTLKTGAVSRRALPGFFMAMNMMLGMDTVEELQERVRKIVSRVRSGRQDEFSWNDIYAAPEAREVTLDALVTMAPYFDDLERRSQWFITMIDGNLVPIDPERPDAAEESEWEMTELGFLGMVHGLFSELRKALAGKNSRSELVKRHGAETCKALATTLRKIDDTCRQAGIK